jgi:hypothetical protein
LLDPLRNHETRLDEDPHMLGQRGLRDAELLGDEKPADAVFDEVAGELGPKMGARILEPLQDLEPALTGKGAEDHGGVHFGTLLID